VRWLKVPPYAVSNAVVGQARNTLFVPGSAGQTAQIVTFIFMLWQPSVSAMPYISSADLRGTHRW